jgi:hypothetical protein
MSSLTPEEISKIEEEERVRAEARTRYTLSSHVPKPPVKKTTNPETIKATKVYLLAILLVVGFEAMSIGSFIERQGGVILSIVGTGMAILGDLFVIYLFVRGFRWIFFKFGRRKREIIKNIFVIGFAGLVMWGFVICDLSYLTKWNTPEQIGYDNRVILTILFMGYLAYREVKPKKESEK